MIKDFDEVVEHMRYFTDKYGVDITQQALTAVLTGYGNTADRPCLKDESPIKKLLSEFWNKLSSKEQEYLLAHVNDVNGFIRQQVSFSEFLMSVPPSQSQEGK